MSVVKGSIHRNREGKEFVVVKVKSENDVVVRFLETNYSCRVRSHLLLAGNVRDYTYLTDAAKSWKPHSEVFDLNGGYKASSLAINRKSVRIKFENTGYTTIVNIDNARAGKVRDPFEASCYGVGYMGLPDKSKTYFKQAKQLWQNMLKRCYSEFDERGYFGKATVDARWLSFESFLSDIENLEGFSDWLKGHTDSYRASNLDKDFYVPGNTVYSRDYCLFLPQAFNKSLGKKDKTESDWA